MIANRKERIRRLFDAAVGMDPVERAAHLAAEAERLEELDLVRKDLVRLYQVWGESEKATKYSALLKGTP